MITREDIAEMNEAELAAFANKGPDGFTPVFEADGRFAFYADSVIEQMNPAQLGRLTFVRRAH